MARKKVKQPWRLGLDVGKYDLATEAADLELWSKNPDSLSLGDFTYNKSYVRSQLYDFASQSDDFSHALKKAVERISRNRERGVSNSLLHHVCWTRYAALSDDDLANHERKIKDEQAERDRGIREIETKNLANITSDALAGLIKQKD